MNTQPHKTKIKVFLPSNDVEYTTLRRFSSEHKLSQQQVDAFLKDKTIYLYDLGTIRAEIIPKRRINLKALVLFLYTLFNFA